MQLGFLEGQLKNQGSMMQGTSEARHTPQQQQQQPQQQPGEVSEHNNSDIIVLPPPLHRLFVGSLPKAPTFNEKDLAAVGFSDCGDVKDIVVLRDRHSGQPRGCAFVSYATREEAEAAINNLDRKIYLPGALCPLEVRFAKSYHYVHAGEGPEDNRQLFFSHVPLQATEGALHALFSDFGTVEELNIFRERRTGRSKGCGLVEMQTRDQALKAIEALDEKHTLEGSNTPLSVKWADPELQLKKKKATEDANAENKMLFFAKVLRSATEDEVRQLFSKFGKVYDVNLFRAFQGAPTTKGCGLVTLGTHEEAVAAIEALDSKFVWEGMESPMVVKWMDTALQRRRREQHLAAMRQGMLPSVSIVPSGIGLAASMPGARLGLGAPAGLLAGQAPFDMEGNETPPPGCQPDALKLFVGNIPKSCTEEQLLPFFETIGKVVELVIVRDKTTHESKGSAFVWYATRAHAERAILQFNLRHVLSDPSGEQDRPLVVRKAKTRAKTVHPAISMLAGAPQVSMGPYGLQRIGGGVVDGLMADGTVGMTSIHLQNQHLNVLTPVTSVGYRGVPHMQVAGGGLVGLQTTSMALPVQNAAMYDAYGAGGAGMGQDALGHTFAMDQGGSQGLETTQMALSLALNQQQLAALNHHLFSVQSVSGVQLHITPGAPGVFHLVLSGQKTQVETAKNLVTTVLQNNLI